MADPGHLSPNQEKALAALLASPTVVAAAERSGLGERTIYRYLKDPEFKRRYDEERAFLVDQTVAGLQKLGIGAVGVLRRNFDAKNPPDQIRAARIVLDLMFKGTERAELVEMQEMLRRITEEGEEADEDY